MSSIRSHTWCLTCWVTLGFVIFGTMFKPRYHGINCTRNLFADHFLLLKLPSVLLQWFSNEVHFWRTLKYPKHGKRNEVLPKLKCSKWEAHIYNKLLFASGRSVLLEQPRKSGSKVISHMLCSHGGEIFLHVLSCVRSILEDPPSISEGCGGRVTDYRITVSHSRKYLLFSQMYMKQILMVWLFLCGLLG